MKMPYLLILGVTITLASLTALFVLPTPITPATIENDGSASRVHSRSTSRVKVGSVGLVTINEYIDERWWWDAPETLNVGDSRTLSVSAEITHVKHTFGGPVDAGIDETVKTPISKPVAVSVSGPFKWGVALSELTKTSADGAKQPLEWSWVFTPEDHGTKIIQIELPAHNAVFETKRQFLVSDDETDPRSRFIQIPIPIGQRGLISQEFASALKFLAWFVGPAFTAPWFIWMMGKMSKTERPKSKIILPPGGEDT